MRRSALPPAIRTGPASLLAPEDFLTREQCKALFDQIVGLTAGGGTTDVSMSSSVSGGAEWALNRVRVASEAHETSVSITRTIRGATGSASTNRLDADGLQHAVRSAEQMVLTGGESPEQRPDYYTDEPTLTPTLWSDTTASVGAAGCTDMAQTLIAPSEAAGMNSAGALRIVAEGTAALNTDGMFRYYKTTEADCSMTVRNTQSSASGWAGMNHYDLAKIDPAALAAKALDKAQRSANPVAVEPGRYTTILEPQAMADLIAPLIHPYTRALDRQTAEMPMGPFGGREPGTSKITEQVLDSRLILRHDPMDPDGGFLPFDWGGTPFQPVNWIDAGILRQLAYRKYYALAALGLDKALPQSHNFRLTPVAGTPTVTIDEMIAKTDRGVLVTRLSGVRLVDFGSMLCGGYTRDGLWLIEKGKITKSIKNFRFNESPLFVLNNLIDVGTPVRVFSQGSAYVAPPVRVRDFSFTSLADAI